MNTPAIEISGVRKSYRFFALDDVSLRLEHGQIMGFVGPNGAGKSTTIRMLMAMVHQDAGEMRVLGHAMPQSRRARSAESASSRTTCASSAARRSPGTWASCGRSIPAGTRPTRRRCCGASTSRPSRHVKGLRTASGQRRRCCSCWRAGRDCWCSTSRPRASTPSPGTRRSRSSWRCWRTRSARSCFRRTTRSTSSRSPIRSRSSTAAGSSTRATRKCSSTAGAGCRSSLPRRRACPAARRHEITRTGHTAVVTTNAYSADLHAPYEQAGATVRDVEPMTLEEIFVATVMHNRKERGE